jgi:hypothetical protein
LAAAELVHEIVAEPAPVTVPGVTAPHVSPVAAMSVNETAALNWLRAVIVIVGTADWPVSTGEG